MSQEEKQKTKPEQDKGFVTIEESREFYRDSYRRVLLFLGGSIALNLLFFVGSAIAVDVSLHKKPMVIAVNPSMQVQPIVPLSAPYVSNAGAATWATKAIENTLNISFSEWQRNLNSASKYYIPSAFDQLVSGLKSSGILQIIVNQRMNTVLMPVSKAYVVKTGMIDGVPAWIIKGVFQLSFQGTTSNEGEKNINVEFIVQRASILQHPSGLVIRSIVLGG